MQSFKNREARIDDMKKLFNTPKKAIIVTVCMVVVIVATSVIAVKNTLITRAEAKAAALRDSGLSEAEASALRARLEFDDGRFQYEVDFYNNGTEYEYLIQAKDGEIIARDIDGGGNSNNDMMVLPQDTGNQFATDNNSSIQPPEDAGNQPDTNGNSTAQPQENSLDEAKAAALKDAGLSESDVTFKKTELDHDHGKQVYDIEFYTSDTEYDYEIDASNGTVFKKNIEQFQIQANPAASAASNSDNNYIGVDRAKEIALNHANLNESDVRFAKAKLENDDGGVEYEIEFYSGQTEYDYTIDAVSGNIIEYDVDYD